MLNQSVLDEIADQLVEQGIRVTYDSINDALKEASRRDGGGGKGKSERDIQLPLSDWKRRRRYRPFLAHVDLPEAMDKAITSFVQRAMTVGREHEGSGDQPLADPLLHDPEPFKALSHQIADHSALTQAQMAALANDLRLVREQVAASTKDRQAGASSGMLKSEDRRRGISAATGRFFWNRMMLSFVEAIQKHGPMTAAELFDTLDDDALAMAEAVFEKVTVTVLREKVVFRISQGKYFRVTETGCYDVLPKHAARTAKRGKR